MPGREGWEECRLRRGEVEREAAREIALAWTVRGLEDGTTEFGLDLVFEIFYVGLGKGLEPQSLLLFF